MIVFRVENEFDGKGPYTSAACMTGVYNSHEQQARRDAPCDDNFYLYDLESFIWAKSTKYGFESLEQLIWWFKGFHSEMEENGYMISQYEVPEEFVWSGDHQVAYDSDHATGVWSSLEFLPEWDMGPHEELISRYRGHGALDPEYSEEEEY